MTSSTLCSMQAISSRSKASVIARAAKGSKLSPSTLKPPVAADQPVGMPRVRGEDVEDVYFQDCVRMAALPAPSCGFLSSPSTTLLKTKIDPAYSGW